MIPKNVHYCWFGGKPLSGITRKCVDSFSILGGQIYEWSEENCSFDENKYVVEAKKNHGWAYLSDYYRLKALYEYGGIYLDTDVEIKQPLNKDFYDADLVLGYMYDCYVSTAFIMAKPHHPFVKQLLDAYETMEYNGNYANNALMTFSLLERYPGFKLNGKFSEFDNNCYIYPKEYFEVPILKGAGGYSVHHFTGFWKQQSKLKKLVKPILKNALFYCPLLNVLYNKRGRKAALLINPCYQRYLHDITE